DAVAALLYQEFLLRQGTGEAPDLDEYRRLFPYCATTLNELHEADLFLEPLLSSDGPPPERFGDYELLEEIGRGGMGIVYRARHVSLDRIVALKMILNGQLATPDEVERFRNEARAAARLQHPSLVAVHEVGEHQGQHYFTMDYVEGGSLAERVQRDPPC